jgi:hypothetical protein
MHDAIVDDQGAGRRLVDEPLSDRGIHREDVQRQRLLPGKV